jgi:hypothetical protein
MIYYKEKFLQDGLYYFEVKMRKEYRALEKFHHGHLIIILYFSKLLQDQLDHG